MAIESKKDQSEVKKERVLTVGTNINYSKMFVIKRDGRKESVMFDKITSRIAKLCYELDMNFIDPPSITLKVLCIFIAVILMICLLFCRLLLCPMNACFCCPPFILLFSFSFILLFNKVLTHRNWGKPLSF